MHGIKKRYKSCVDKMMQKCTNSMNISSSTRRLPTNDTQHKYVSYCLLANNIQPENVNGNNKLNDDLNDEDEIIVDKKVLIIDEDESIEDKGDYKPEVEEDDYIVDEKLLQDKMTDYFLDKCNVIG